VDEVGSLWVEEPQAPAADSGPRAASDR
jgi:hypothetical protein